MDIDLEGRLDNDSVQALLENDTDIETTQASCLNNANYQEPSEGEAIEMQDLNLKDPSTSSDLFIVHDIQQ